MVTTREITGTKEQIADQIRHLGGRVLSATVWVEEAESSGNTLSDEKFLALLAEMDADTMSVGHVDDSREAIYTRMPGE